MLNDTLANALSKIMNAEKVGKKECIIDPASKIIRKVLDIMKDNGYIGEYKDVESSQGTFIVVNLLGNINHCNAIKPRYSVGIDTFVKFEKRYLLSHEFGLLILSTHKGIMTHKQAKENKTGGRLLAVCY